MENLKYDVDTIINKVLDKNNKFWETKDVHSSGHGGQHKDHGNSKVQLHFNIDKFYKEFSIPDSSREKFELIFGEKTITKDGLFAVFENQETRDVHKNEEIILNHLKSLLQEFFKEDKERITVEIPECVDDPYMTKKMKKSVKKKIKEEEKFCRIWNNTEEENSVVEIGEAYI